MVNDDWYTVTKIGSSTFAISEYGHWEEVHSFLLIGETESVLIDSGLGIKSISSVVRQLTTTKITVLTTHVHWDHIGSHGEFDTIAVHEADVQWLEEGIPVAIEQIKRDLTSELKKPLPKEFRIQDYEVFRGKPTFLIFDGDKIDLGNREIQAIHTPGHSPSHLVFYDSLTGFLFTGDLLYVDAPIYAFYPSTSPTDLVNSLLKISEIEAVTRVFGSHHSLGIDATVLMQAREAANYIKRNELDRFGTGLHTFNQLSFLF